MDELMILCREVDRKTGHIALYEIKTPVTDELLFKLGIRARVNPELKYFVVMRDYYTENKNILEAAIKRQSRILVKMPIKEL